jgi:hypothetical protein
LGRRVRFRGTFGPLRALGPFWTFRPFGAFRMRFLGVLLVLFRFGGRFFGGLVVLFLRRGGSYRG